MLEKLPDAVGHALRDQRAGLDKCASTLVPLAQGTAAISVSSTAFIDHGPLPVRYTADGEGLSPPLQWQGVPPGATSVALLVEDADAPTPKPLVHAIVVHLPAGTAAADAMMDTAGSAVGDDVSAGLNAGLSAGPSGGVSSGMSRGIGSGMGSGLGDATGAGAIAEGALDSPDHDGAGLDAGRNSFLRSGWLPPDPPPGHGPHRYVFQVYALGPGAVFSETPGRDELLDALRDHAVASGWMIGTYERADTAIEETTTTSVGALAAPI